MSAGKPAHMAIADMDIEHSKPMEQRDTGGNAIWCLAWRLLVKHQDSVDAVIAYQTDLCFANSDPDGVTYWRKVAAALEDFR